MREILTKRIEIGEHVLIDGVECVAGSGDCGVCEFDDYTNCPYSLFCPLGGKLTKVEKQPTETQDKDTPMTYPQLAEWLAKGLGQCKCGTGKHIFTNMTISEDEENLAIDYTILIRPWGKDEWVKPTVGIYERDCK